MNTRDDERVNLVLRHLGVPDPPVGMERRILVAVETRVTTRASAGRGWLRWQITNRPLVYAGALASIIIVVLLAVPYLYHSKSAPALSRTTAMASSRNMVPTRSATNTVHLPAAPIARSLREPYRASAPVRASENAINADVSGANNLGASYPAPPMPLTEQERLLLRVVHKGDPEELAMLEPQALARFEARSAAEFQAFFPPELIEETKQNP